MPPFLSRERGREGNMVDILDPRYIEFRRNPPSQRVGVLSPMQSPTSEETLQTVRDFAESYSIRINLRDGRSDILTFLTLHELEERLQILYSDSVITSDEAESVRMEAENMFQRREITPPQTASSKQRWMAKMPEKFLKGIEVTIISANVRGIIVKADKGKISVLVGNDIGQYTFDQLDPILDLSKIDFPIVQEIITEEFVETMIQRKQKGRPNIARDIETKKRTIEEMQKKIRLLKKELKLMPLPKKEEALYSKKHLITLLTQLRAHAKVEDAYLSREGKIIVITKMLYPIKKNKENKKSQVGRFSISYNHSSRQGVQRITIVNLDYVLHTDDNSYYHPNIRTDGSICWGENKQEVENMWSRDELYELTDFIILFLSLFPHDEGSPYTDPEGWLENKEKVQSGSLEQKVL